jgi:hypothetical protein
LWAGKNSSAVAAVSIPAFVIPIDNAEQLELVGFPESLPITQAVDLNSRVSPAVVQQSTTKFHVSGQNCWIKDGLLRASEPAICKVIAARAGNSFSPITVLSTPTFFYFGTIATEPTSQRLPLPTLNVPLPTLVISNDPTTSAPGKPIILITTGANDIGVVTYTEKNGNTRCIIGENELKQATLNKTTSGTCQIRAIAMSSGSSIVQFSQTIVFTFTD